MESELPRTAQRFIDRKLQPSPEVYCHYFLCTQRPEDRVLQALVRKTETIRRELGSLAEVLEERLHGTIRGGIQRWQIDAKVEEIKNAALDPARRSTADAELESTRAQS